MTRFAGMTIIAVGMAFPAIAAIVLRDDAGRDVRLQQPAQRMATLAPFLTELAFSAGAGDKVVAVSEHSDWPPEARSRPQVSSATSVALESLVAAHPDLVLAWQDAIRPADIERLAALGIPVFIAQARSLEDVPRLLEAIAKLAGTNARGVADGYRSRLAALRASHADRPPIPVLVEIWHRPLTTLAGRHWINEAITLCGGRNAFADLPGVAPTVSWELVLARDPRVIVGAGSAADATAFEAQWAQRPALSAVRGKRLVFIPGDLLQRPTLRLAEGVAQLCAGLDAAR